ncbi:flagellin [Roseibacterium sp. SDUM158016]|uniref:flagellin N-terminal helical domain-containing protein n=1 Tax=Roseicyclus sediminis TaxID=2980997 RepID=UPI0021D16BA5|nr:flagellin [Roseibacterium sp. SDUM158016]MCU4654333.1 flagellin [Roseibacterium sp. SDUM158016]
MTSISGTLSTLTAANFRRETVADIQQRLERASEEMSTGRKSDVYAALGFRASELLSVRSSAASNENFLTGNRLVANKMELMATTLGTVRETVQDFLDIAIANRTTPGPTVRVVAQSAKAAYEQVVTQLNATYQGAHLFSGTESGRTALQTWGQANEITGLSPSDVLAGVVGPQIVDAADAQAKLDEVTRIFSSTNAAAPETHFEASFYRGTPLLDAGGVPSPRVTARIDDATVLNYGIQANDPPFTLALQGLAMLASVDPATVSDPGAYRVWVDAAVEGILNGIEGITGIEARLGTQQRTVEDTIIRQEGRADVYEKYIDALEGVDPFEAATRVKQLSTQLEAAYAISARISRLSFLDYMR